MNNILENIKHKFKYAGIVEKLIYINLALFLMVFIVNTFGFLFNTKSNFLIDWLSLPASFDDFLYKPWTLITYGFLHAGFLHILFNLIALFFIGNLFKQYFTSKQLLDFYLYGTLFGGLIFMISYNFFPALQNDTDRSILIGASAGISAIFIGVATYMPNYEVKFPLIGFVKLWILAAIWIAIDIIQIPVSNTGGRLAHLGGALFGFMYVSYASNKEITIFNSLTEIFKKKEKKAPLKTVYNSGKKNTYTNESNKSSNQREVDSILDKISKSGYETLSKEEKDFLFRQGKN
ncbi:Membrane associated serine protease, rhomboid family [Tenacibaculum sp. MAR_2009_124]|uniref:rhomboid family intramembrane serine protease n=1 Tax=Tenacibaculum sp. MAR_2009_124 TaxID=1250059 RepID=UPI0008952CEE|nr:rhomboid family intramembrane serine protease [Tenacibaculum sp. MAR_2009_124]SEB35271.1 Membrane associated serine protease, rhomboid family [Tenacibaculum sp. MAR_2009_124]